MHLNAYKIMYMFKKSKETKIALVALVLVFMLGSARADTGTLIDPHWILTSSDTQIPQHIFIPNQPNSLDNVRGVVDAPKKKEGDTVLRLIRLKEPAIDAELDRRLRESDKNISDKLINSKGLSDDPILFSDSSDNSIPGRGKGLFIITENDPTLIAVRASTKRLPLGVRQQAWIDSVIINDALSSDSSNTLKNDLADPLIPPTQQPPEAKEVVMADDTRPAKAPDTPQPVTLPPVIPVITQPSHTSPKHNRQPAAQKQLTSEEKLLKYEDDWKKKKKVELSYVRKINARGYGSILLRIADGVANTGSVQPTRIILKAIIKPGVASEFKDSTDTPLSKDSKAYAFIKQLERAHAKKSGEVNFRVTLQGLNVETSQIDSRYKQTKRLDATEVSDLCSAVGGVILLQELAIAEEAEEAERMARNFRPAYVSRN